MVVKTLFLMIVTSPCAELVVTGLAVLDTCLNVGIVEKKPKRTSAKNVSNASRAVIVLDARIVIAKISIAFVTVYKIIATFVMVLRMLSQVWAMFATVVQMACIMAAKTTLNIRWNE
jgi:hypothetical protein